MATILSPRRSILGRITDRGVLGYGSSFSPRFLPGLSAWYDASDPASLIYNGSDQTSLVGDQSGNSAVNGLVLDGSTGNYASTPDSAALSITGDIDIRAEVQMPDWTPSTSMAVVAKDDNGVSGGGDRAYLFFITTDGKLNLFWYSSSGFAAASSVATGFADHSRNWIRATLDVDNGSSEREIKFWTSTDGINWTQLGTTVTGAVTFIQNTAYPVNVGANQNGAGVPLLGTVYRAQIYNGIAGTLAFDANFTTAPKLATSFTESSANAATVTINTSGATGARIAGARDLYQGTVANQPVYVAPYSPDELVTGDNSTFASDTGFWNKIGATISGGAANLTVGTALRRNGLVTIGRRYRVTFTVSGFSFGGVNPVFDDGAAVIQTITGNGSYDFTYTANITDVLFSANTSAFSVTNVTVGAVGGPASIYFDGSNDFLKSPAFSFVQPETVYFVGSQVTWTSNDYIFDGDSGDTMSFRQTSGGVSPNVEMRANGTPLGITGPALNARFLGSMVFNAASSTIRINNGTANSAGATIGAANGGGFTLGCYGNGAAVFSNITCNEVAIYNVAHTAAQQQAFWVYASRKWLIS